MKYVEAKKKTYKNRKQPPKSKNLKQTQSLPLLSFTVILCRFVAVIAMDIDFFSIDLNPCPLGIGNEAPNYFAGTARCKDTTMVSQAGPDQSSVHIITFFFFVCFFLKPQEYKEA